MVDQTQTQASIRSQVFVSGWEPVFIATRSKDYPTWERRVVEKDAIDVPSYSTPPNSDPLHIERPSSDSII